MKRKLVLFLVLLLLSFPFVFANTFMESNYAAVVQEVRAGYPELDGVSIEFVFKPLDGISMAARPHPSFLFTSRDKHRYKVFINTQYAPDALVLSNYSQTALVGITAHEFAHIVDYSSMNDWQIIGMGIKYVLSKDFKREMEHATDEAAIAHGFGPQLLESVSNQYASASYWGHKAEFYYSPDEIKELVNAHNKKVTTNS